MPVTEPQSLAHLGKYSVARNVDVDETEDNISTGPAYVYGWDIFNGSAGTRYVKFYNAVAADVVVGTTVPLLTIGLATLTRTTIEFSGGIPFSTAVSIAATTGAADTDTGAPGANDVVANIFYRGS